MLIIINKSLGRREFVISHASDEGIVERIVYFTTSESNTKGNKISVYIRNCGSKFIYYLRPFSTNYFYTLVGSSQT